MIYFLSTRTKTRQKWLHRWTTEKKSIGRIYLFWNGMCAQVVIYLLRMMLLKFWNSCRQMIFHCKIFWKGLQNIWFFCLYIFFPICLYPSFFWNVTFTLVWNFDQCKNNAMPLKKDMPDKIFTICQVKYLIMLNSNILTIIFLNHEIETYDIKKSIRKLYS